MNQVIGFLRRRRSLFIDSKLMQTSDIREGRLWDLSGSSVEPLRDLLLVLKLTSYDDRTKPTSSFASTLRSITQTDINVFICLEFVQQLIKP